MRNVKITAFLLLAVLLVLSCASAKKPKEQGPPKLVTLSGVVPTLEPAEGYAYDLTKEAVTINLTVEEFIHKPVYERSLEEQFELVRVNSEKKYKVTETPHHLMISPDNLTMTLHVVNGLNHVLRLNGSVLSLKIDGKSVAIDNTTVNEFTRAVLTPYEDMDVTLTGPEVEAITNASTVIFSIYDVITAVDEANNPVKRTNFEWVFSVRPQKVSEELPVNVKEQRLSLAQVNSLKKYFVPTGY